MTENVNKPNPAVAESHSANPEETVRVYLYNEFNRDWWRTCIPCDAPKSEADRMVEKDYEQRCKELGDGVQRRTPQQILNSMNNRSYRSDSRYYDKHISESHPVEKDGTWVSLLDYARNTPSESNNPEQIVLNKVSKVLREEAVKELLQLVTANQLVRITQHFFEGKTLTEIAREEGRDVKTIEESINAGLARIRKNLTIEQMRNLLN